MTLLMNNENSIFLLLPKHYLYFSHHQYILNLNNKIKNNKSNKSVNLDKPYELQIQLVYPIHPMNEQMIENARNINFFK
jgi:hypothetical protein